MFSIPAIILAAGESKRMGFPKALLRVGRKTLLEDQIARLKKAGCAPIVVVVGKDASSIVAQAFRPAKLSRPKGLRYDGVKIIPNNHWRLGQFSSIKAGLKEVSSRQARRIKNGCLILPVDVPFVPVTTIKKICNVATKQSKLCNYTAIIPCYESTSARASKRTSAQTHQPTNPPTNKGHPIWISDKLIKMIKRTPAETGRLDLMLSKDANVHLLKVKTNKILHNINTPSQFRALTKT